MQLIVHDSRTTHGTKLNLSAPQKEGTKEDETRARLVKIWRMVTATCLTGNRTNFDQKTGWALTKEQGVKCVAEQMSLMCTTCLVVVTTMNLSALWKQEKKSQLKMFCFCLDQESR